jgi:hypothetical protein
MPDSEKNFYLNDEGKEEPEEVNLGEEDAITNTESVAQNTFKLFTGEELSFEDLKIVTYRYPANMVYILGEHDSGKTTILSTLYEMFQFSPFNELHFAGSFTQVGFEKRCFHSRLSSKNKEADTERTKTEEFKFLHLALKRIPKSRTAVHYLISDISGEKITRAKNDSKEMKDLMVISNAKHVSYIIDGEKLKDIKTRQAILSQAKIFIRKAIDEGVFNHETRLLVIISKWDLLDGKKDFNFDALIKEPFTRDFASSVKKFDTLKIAVRPKKFHKFKLGHGLSDLLLHWQPLLPEQPMAVQHNASGRMIDKFKF